MPGEEPHGASEPGAPGVWVVREASREALRNLPRKFETLEAALADMATRIRTPAGEWRPHSELVRGAGQTMGAKYFEVRVGDRCL
jgi:hypothetical protein